MLLREQDIQALGERGWFIREGWRGEAEALAARAEALAQVEAGALRPAAIRRGADRKVDTAVRGDFTTWVTLESAPALGRLWQDYARLGQALSAEAYMGLGHFDVQLAWYPGRGEGYARHLDAFPGRSNRRVTALYYLNPGWGPAHGGALRLYTEAGPVEVAPVLDTLVVFLSERLAHEVCAAHAPRLALTAWFYGRDAS